VPTTDLGRRGGELVLALLAGGNDRRADATDIVLAPELVIRKSSGPPPEVDGGQESPKRLEVTDPRVDPSGPRH
ncbi:MAG TPA: hypothetical protein VJQ79_11075, partial [Acidimicrobiia bacterium]|nr:hypothetical protein [Acidimicrobiia bacterium]